MEMAVEILHSTFGDKKKVLTGKEIKKMIRRGTAIFLERKGKGNSKRTYRVTDFDEANDRLIVRVAAKGETKLVKTTGKGRTATAVAPVAGG